MKLNKSLICVSVLVLGLTSFFSERASAQGPDDEHWFYDYPGPSPEPVVFERDGRYLYTGGIFLSTNGDTDLKGVARFDLYTETWQKVPGLDNPIAGAVWAIHAADNNRLYFGGNISNAAGTSSSGIVELNKANGVWSALFDPNDSLTSVGQQRGPTNGRVRAIVKIGNYVYVGGEFTGPSGSPQGEKYIRRFDLATRRWEPVGMGLDGDVHSLLAMPDGKLMAVGQFTGLISVWDGSRWSVFEGGASGSVVRDVVVRDEKAYFFCGDFEQVGGSLTVADVAMFDVDSGWEALAGGFDTQYIQDNGTAFGSEGLYDIMVGGDGNVYVGGDIQADVGRVNRKLNHVAMWDGSGSWKNLGSGVGSTGSQIVNCISPGLGCDIFVGGTFSEGWRKNASANTQFARWDVSFDFNDYVPGARDNPTTEIELVDDQWEILIQTRPGTTYELQSSGDMGSWSTISGTTLVGNGNFRGWAVTAPGGATKRFYRYKAVSF